MLQNGKGHEKGERDVYTIALDGWQFQYDKDWFYYKRFRVVLVKVNGRLRMNHTLGTLTIRF
jgi:hypothetical protein